MRPSRIHDIDLIRGLMLLSMALNHGSAMTRLLGRESGSIVTFSQILPSSPAEVFFLLSGYLFGHVRLASARSIRDIPLGWSIRRIRNLILFNTATFLILLACMPFAAEPLLRAARFEDAVHRPVTALVRLITLSEAPFCLDVLQVYIVFLAFTPLFAVLMIASRAAAAAWLLVCWSIVQVLFHHGSIVPDATIAMDLWAWQGLFFGGMLLGAARVYRPLVEAMTRSPRIIASAAATLLVLLAAVFGAQHFSWLGLAAAPWILSGNDRQTLGPLNVVSSITLLLVLIWAADRFRLSETVIGRWLTATGRVSLSTFCISNLAVYATGFVWQVWPTRGSYLLMSAAMVAVMLAWGVGAEAFRRRATVRAAGTPLVPQQAV